MTVRWNEPTERQARQWAEEVTRFPAIIQPVAHEFDPWAVWLLPPGQLDNAETLAVRVLSFVDTGAEGHLDGCGWTRGHCAHGCQIAIPRVLLTVYAHDPVIGGPSARKLTGVQPRDLWPWPSGTPFEPAPGHGDAALAAMYVSELGPEELAEVALAAATEKVMSSDRGGSVTVIEPDAEALDAIAPADPGTRRLNRRGVFALMLAMLGAGGRGRG